MWYHFVGYVGASLGSLASGWTVEGLIARGYELNGSYRAVFGVFAVCSVLESILVASMGRAVEVEAEQGNDTQRRGRQDGPEDERRLLLEPSPVLLDGEVEPKQQSTSLHRLIFLCVIYGIDSFAGGLVPSSLTAYWLRLAFNAPLHAISTAFGLSSLLAGFSQLAAGSVSQRLGLVTTMVCTHCE